MQQVILMIGIPGSGKTTYVKNNFQNYEHISLDINNENRTSAKWQKLLYRYESENPFVFDTQSISYPINPAGKKYQKSLSYTQNSNNRKAEYIQTSDALVLGKNIVIDDTNLTKELRWPYIVLARLHKATVHGILFSNIQQAHERNKKRTGRKRVPDKIMVQKFQIFEWPNISEGFDSIVSV